MFNFDSLSQIKEVQAEYSACTSHIISCINILANSNVLTTHGLKQAKDLTKDDVSLEHSKITKRREINASIQNF